MVKIELVVTVIAALAAVAAACFALRNSNIAKRALQIAEQTLATKTAGVTIYLIEGFRRLEADHHYLVAFALSFTNQADSPNSIARIELQVEYITNDGRLTNLLFPLEPAAPAASQMRNLAKLSAPLNLLAKSTESGWTFFKLPLNAVSGTIHRYRILAILGSGQLASVESYLIRTITNENERV